MNNKIYMIFYDRGFRAQDNGEYLCRWVMKNHPEIKTAYIVNKTSPDWDRLAKEGFTLIDALNPIATHTELLKCDYACSSIFNECTRFNFSGCTCKRIFLNHGCFLVPINYIRKQQGIIDLFIAANAIEYEVFLNSFHGLTPDQVALCGQPRQDSLIKAQLSPHKEDSILIQFWMRPSTWRANNNAVFLNSKFFKATTALLSNEKLLKKCRENNLKLVFKMHNVQYDWLKYYKQYENDIVRLSGLLEPFEPEFVRSKFMITDISSNAYEMAKIGKPCIYFEPDPEELFSWRYSRNGGWEFDLEHKSIGPVIKYSVDTLVTEIFKLIDNNYKLDDIYLERREEQISFLNDSGNCERCFEAILNTPRSRTAEETYAKAKERVAIAHYDWW